MDQIFNCAFEYGRLVRANKLDGLASWDFLKKVRPILQQIFKI